MSFAYQNPIWPGYLADPFILRHEGVYYAYGTGSSGGNVPAGTGVFPLLRSPNLVDWEDLGGVLQRPNDGVDRAYWAPEVAERGGQFFLYYSRAPAGQDERHRLRVAVAGSPTGPFVDQGEVLPADEGFSIDAHPFRDPRDQRWYLFFARDYFDERVGTGIAVAPLADSMTRTDGPSRPVLRADNDWQIYQRNRQIYGREWTAWHTVEGPSVVYHDDRYWCFYSGGNWQTRDYGVSYGVADHPLGPWRHADAPHSRVLQERPGEVLGPGHNSVTTTPDGRTPLIVYHAWDPAATARRICIDPLVWTKDGPRCAGPSTGRQLIG